MTVTIRGKQLELPPYVYQKVRPGMPKGVYMWHIENGEYADLGEELFVALCEIGWRREAERLRDIFDPEVSYQEAYHELIGMAQQALRGEGEK